MTSERSGPVGKGGWPGKFAAAISGLSHSVRTQSSFWVHVPVGIAVLSVAGWLRVDAWRWATLLIVISLVLSAELINTSIELIVRVVHPEHDPRIGQALDAAAGAVLVMAIGAVGVGVITLGVPLWELFVQG